MSFPISRYGWREIIFSGIILALAGIVLYQIHYGLLLVPLFLFGLVVYFFRDPERNIPQGDNFILAPADGKVVEIAEVYEPNFIKQDSIKVGIFMSFFNVHINRAPCSGIVRWLSYQPGKFKIASHPQAAALNESNSIGIIKQSSDEVKILVKQIAGIIARRIVCLCQDNDQLTLGQKIGMIKFGSRVEVYIPKEKLASVCIQLKDKTRAGETIIGYLK